MIYIAMSHIMLRRLVRAKINSKTRSKIRRNKNMVAKLMEKYVQLKKSFGDPEWRLGLPRHIQCRYSLRQSLIRARRVADLPLCELARNRTE